MRPTKFRLNSDDGSASAWDATANSASAITARRICAHNSSEVSG